MSDEITLVQRYEPGPWGARTSNGTGETMVYSARGLPVCSLPPEELIRSARYNKRLVACSPEMIEALMSMHHLCNFLCKTIVEELNGDSAASLQILSTQGVILRLLLRAGVAIEQKGEDDAG